jgi:hypothetical protein
MFRSQRDDRSVKLPWECWILGHDWRRQDADVAGKVQFCRRCGSEELVLALVAKFPGRGIALMTTPCPFVDAAAVSMSPPQRGGTIGFHAATPGSVVQVAAGHAIDQEASSDGTEELAWPTDPT